MRQTVEQTHEEKVKMYMKSPKKELCEMVIECNRLFEISRRSLKNVLGNIPHYHSQKREKELRDYYLCQ